MATGEGGTTTQADGKAGEKQQGLVLYYYTYSFYSQKVVMVLHEKHLPYSTHPVNIVSGENLQNWYLKLNSKAEVPVLKDGETVICDSGRIINYLEDKYNNDDKIPKLLPSGDNQELTGKHTHFTTIIRDLNIPVLTYGIIHNPEFSRNPRMPFILPFRRAMKGSLDKKPAKIKQLAEKNADFAEALLEKAEKTEKFKEALLDKAAFEELLNKIDQVLDEVETQLASNEGDENWLLTKDFLLADVELTVLLERIYLLGMDERFWGAGKKPNLAKYYTRAKQRESYKKTMPTLMFHLKTLVTGVSLLLP